MCDLTDREKEIKDRYTKVTKNNDKQVLYLKIDHQSFEILQDCDSERILWFQEQLSMALTRMIEDVKNFKTNVPHIVISITDPDKDFPEYPDNPSRLGILKLKFHDYDPVRFVNEVPDPKYLFNDDQAFEILKFLSKYFREIKAIVCQCEMGVSRSAGVALALTAIFEEEYLEEMIKEHKLANIHVFEKICNTYAEFIEMRFTSFLN